MPFDISHVTFASQDGTALAATAAGPATGLPVLLSHGGGQTRHAWGATARRLAELGFRAIALDLRGHGDSGWAASDYTIRAYADDLRLVAAQLARPVVLVGASLGGIASILAAGEAPAIAIAGLVLVDVASRMRPEGTEEIGRFMRSTSEGFASIEEAAAAVAAFLPHRPRPRDTSGLAKNLRRDGEGRYRWHWDPRTLHSIDLADADARMEQAAAHIACPALLLRGTDSALVTRDIAVDFMARFEDGRVIDIAGARHMIAGDRNDQFGEGLIGFLTGLPGAR